MCTEPNTLSATQSDMGASVSKMPAEQQQELADYLNAESIKEVDASDIGSDPGALKTEVIRLRALFNSVRNMVQKAQQSKHRPSKNTLENGTTIETFADGRRLQISPDGTKIEELPDGTQIQTSPNGGKLTKRKDGSMLQESPDGSSVEKFADGGLIQIFSNKTKLEVRADGTKIQTSPDGNVIKVFPDGTKISNLPNGTIITTYPDGRKVQRNPNGTVIENFPDGRVVQTKADGSQFKKYPDGRTIEISNTGDVLERLTDGTVLEKKLKTTSTKPCWQCGTVAAIPMGKYIFSCGMCRTIMLAQKTEVSDDHEADRQREMKACFEYFDKNKAQSIGKNALGDMLTQLNFGPQAFPELFTEADANKDGVLQYPEFIVYFGLLQKKMLMTASASMVEAAKDILEAQKADLNKERIRLEAQNAELKSKLSTDANAKAALASAEEQLERVKNEFQKKEEHSNNIMNEQKRRHSTLMQKRLAARRNKKK